MNITKTPEKIIFHLKMNGACTASELAKTFGMTSEGMRLHLLKLEENGLIASESKSKGVGRPSIVYRLTDKARIQFPDNHARLSAQLLESVQRVLGEQALQLLIDDKKHNDFIRYEKALENVTGLEARLTLLTEIRNNEGYMAEMIREDDHWLFVENNCPICSAAASCKAFCQSEFENIQRLLGEKIRIERREHNASGDRRCTYRIY